MATSTEESVREVLVGALRGIAVSDLGFDDSEGNIKDYLLEYEPEESHFEYLAAKVGGENVIRCWAVQVFPAREEFFSTDNRKTRYYDIQIEAYYNLGTQGSGVKLLAEHLRRVWSAIVALTTRLNGTVTLTSGWSLSGPTVVRTGKDTDDWVQITLATTAERDQPDY